MPPRTGTVVGIFGVLLGVILAVQLAFNFHGTSRANQFSRSLPLQSTRADKSATEDDIFNVGIGKADVTGYSELIISWAYLSWHNLIISIGRL